MSCKCHRGLERGWTQPTPVCCCLSNACLIQSCVCVCMCMCVCVNASTTACVRSPCCMHTVQACLWMGACSWITYPLQAITFSAEELFFFFVYPLVNTHKTGEVCTKSLKFWLYEAFKINVIHELQLNKKRAFCVLLFVYLWHKKFRFCLSICQNGGWTYLRYLFYTYKQLIVVMELWSKNDITHFRYHNI